MGTNGSVNASTTLTVTASSDNYEDITVKVNIQIVDKYTVVEKEDAKVAITGSNRNPCMGNTECYTKCRNPNC